MMEKIPESAGILKFQPENRLRDSENCLRDSDNRLRDFENRLRDLTSLALS